MKATTVTMANITEQALEAADKDPRAAAGMLLGIAWEIINSSHGSELADYWLFETTINGIRERKQASNAPTQH